MTKVTDERLAAFMRFQHDINERVFKGSLNPGDVENALRPLIGQKSKSASGRQSFEIEVDGTKTLEQLIADGKYDWKNSDIKKKNFPIKIETKRTATIELFHFGRNISSEDAAKEMEKEGMRPATIEELLALGAKHPDLQREFPIIALGSVWQDFFGNRGVPGLCLGDDGRSLSLDDWGGDWGGNYRFAGFRKNS